MSLASKKARLFFVLLSMSIAFKDTLKNSETILFIHGLGCTASIWEELSVKLSKEYRCISIDLPSYGNSSELTGTYSLNAITEELYKFILNLNIDAQKLHICGHSMGGQLAIILALRYPNIFNKLILISPAGFEQFTERELQLIKAGTNMLPSDLMKKSTLAMINEPVYEYLHTITHQTLILFGTNDPMIPNPMIRKNTTSQLAEHCTKLIKRAKLIMIPHKGHFLPLDSVNELSEEVRKFI
jgi:pimeloyl-ACP methyl ester carboxylesterase